AGRVQDMELSELLVHFDALDLLGHLVPGLAAELHHALADLELDVPEHLFAILDGEEVPFSRVIAKLLRELVRELVLEVHCGELLSLGSYKATHTAHRRNHK